MEARRRMDIVPADQNSIVKSPKANTSQPARIAGVLLLALALTMSACAPKKQEAACGYSQNNYGERVSWNDRLPVEIILHEDFPSDYVGAVESAIKTWEKAAGRKLFELSTSRFAGSSSPARDGSNVIYFNSTWDTYDRDEQGRTSIYVVGDQIVESDMIINNRDFAFYWPPAGGSRTGVNIEALLVHELGHILGLKHNDSGSSVMQTHLAPGSDRVDLTSADVNSLKCEY